MAFLAIPLILVVLAALIVRLKNTGKLEKLNLVTVGNTIETKHKELGKWISRTASNKKRNGFTRLNQDSEGEEAERLTKRDDSTPDGLSNNKGYNTDSDSESEVEISLPSLSKAWVIFAACEGRGDVDRWAGNYFFFHSLFISFFAFIIIIIIIKGFLFIAVAVTVTVTIKLLNINSKTLIREFYIRFFSIYLSFLSLFFSFILSQSETFFLMKLSKS
jgi:hypothetical protein